MEVFNGSEGVGRVVNVVKSGVKWIGEWNDLNVGQIVQKRDFKGHPGN